MGPELPGPVPCLLLGDVFVSCNTGQHLWSTDEPEILEAVVPSTSAAAEDASKRKRRRHRKERQQPRMGLLTRFVLDSAVPVGGRTLLFAQEDTAERVRQLQLLQRYRKIAGDAPQQQAAAATRADVARNRHPPGWLRLPTVALPWLGGRDAAGRRKSGSVRLEDANISLNPAREPAEHGAGAVGAAAGAESRRSSNTSSSSSAEDLIASYKLQERDALLTEGRLLEQGELTGGGGGPGQVFDLWSYVGRIPLEVAMKLRLASARGRIPDTHDIVASDRDVQVLNRLNGQPAALDLRLSSSSSWAVAHRNVRSGSNGSSGNDASVLRRDGGGSSGVSSSSCDSKRGGLRTGTIECSSHDKSSWNGCSTSKASSYSAASSSSSSTAYSSTTPSSDTARTGSSASIAWTSVQGVKQLKPTPQPGVVGYSGRTPVFRLPGVTLSLATSRGPVRFSPAFLSVEHMREFAEAARSTTLKVWLSSRKQRRDRWRQYVDAYAVSLAGFARVSLPPSSGSAAAGKGDSEDEGGYSDPPEAKELLEELGERGGGGKGTGALLPPPTGALQVLNTIAVGAISMVTSAVASFADRVDRVLVGTGPGLRAIGIPSRVNFQAGYLEDVVAELAAHNSGKLLPACDKGSSGTSCSDGSGGRRALDSRGSSTNGIDDLAPSHTKPPSDGGAGGVDDNMFSPSLRQLALLTGPPQQQQRQQQEESSPASDMVPNCAMLPQLSTVPSCGCLMLHERRDAVTAAPAAGDEDAPSSSSCSPHLHAGRYHSCTAGRVQTSSHSMLYGASRHDCVGVHDSNASSGDRAIALHCWLSALRHGSSVAGGGSANSIPSGGGGDGAAGSDTQPPGSTAPLPPSRDDNPGPSGSSSRRSKVRALSLRRHPPKPPRLSLESLEGLQALLGVGWLALWDLQHRDGSVAAALVGSHLKQQHRDRDAASGAEGGRAEMRATGQGELHARLLVSLKTWQGPQQQPASLLMPRQRLTKLAKTTAAAASGAKANAIGTKKAAANGAASAEPPAGPVTHEFELGLHLNMSKLVGDADAADQDTLLQPGDALMPRGLLLVGDLGLDSKHAVEVPWRTPPLGFADLAGLLRPMYYSGGEAVAA